MRGCASRRPTCLPRCHQLLPLAAPTSESEQMLDSLTTLPRVSSSNESPSGNSDLQNRWKTFAVSSCGEAKSWGESCAELRPLSDITKNNTSRRKSRAKVGEAGKDALGDGEKGRRDGCAKGAEPGRWMRQWTESAFPTCRGQLLMIERV